jgi:hypothetical protein
MYAIWGLSAGAFVVLAGVEAGCTCVVCGLTWVGTRFVPYITTTDANIKMTTTMETRITT